VSGAVGVERPQHCDLGPLAGDVGRHGESDEHEQHADAEAESGPPRDSGHGEPAAAADGGVGRDRRKP